MIRGMVDRLAARLEQNPNDKEGWTRLAHAYDVLGEKDKAEAARARAAGGIRRLRRQSPASHQVIGRRVLTWASRDNGMTEALYPVCARPAQSG